MSSNGIVPMLLDRIAMHLTEKMHTLIPEDDPSRADLVKIGRFQDNPVKYNVYVAISPGDPEDTNWVDGIVTLESMKNIGFYVDPREIGGSQMWWRRGIAQLGCYFIREKFVEEEALRWAYTALGRLQHNIENIQVTDLTDSYGEQAVKMFHYAYSFSESGGPPKSYVWRGKVHWQCLTEIPY